MRQLIEQMLEAMEVWSDARLSAQGQKAITAARSWLAQPEQSEPDWKKPPEYVPPLVKWAQEQTAPPLREPEQSEPVAWLSESGAWVTTSKAMFEHESAKGKVMTPLYK